MRDVFFTGSSSAAEVAVSESVEGSLSEGERCESASSDFCRSSASQQPIRT